MASRWKWFLGGAVCGFVVALFGLLVLALVTMRIDWDQLPGAPKIPEDSVTWEEREEAESSVHQQVNEQGHAHGLFRRFAADGRLVVEGQYFRSNEDGHWVWWEPDGSWGAIGGFLDGEEHGTWIFWNADSRLEQPVDLAVISYSHGIKQGPLTAWKEDGSLDSEVTGWYEGDVRVRDLEAYEVHGRPWG